MPPKKERRIATKVGTELDQDDPQTRLLIPTARQGPFLPFERFAESVAAHRMSFGLHPHVAEEVLTYVLQGYVHHEDAEGHHATLTTGSVLLLTAHREFRHEITLQPRAEAHDARWLSLVLRLSWHTEAPETSVQVREAGDRVQAGDGTSRWPVVGPQARAESAIGLECTHICFDEGAAVSVPLSLGRRGIAYVLEGSGRIERREVAAGEGILFENAPSVALEGPPGFRVFLASVPTAGSDESYPVGERFQGARFPGGRDRSPASARAGRTS